MAKTTKYDKKDLSTKIDFLVNELSNGIERVNALSKFVKKWQVTPRTFDRYWKQAKTQHIAAQELINKELLKDNTSAAKERLKKDILTKDEAMELLTQYAKRSKLVIRVKNVNGEEKEYHDRCSPGESMKAIETLSKMNPDWLAASKVEHSGNIDGFNIIISNKDK